MAERDTVELSGDLRSEDQRRKTKSILDNLWESGVENLDIDLSGVTGIDFDSFTELLKTRNRFILAGRKVELKNIPRQIMRIIQIFHIPIADSDQRLRNTR